MVYLYVIGRHKEGVEDKIEFDTSYILNPVEMPNSIREEYEKQGKLVLQEIKLPDTTEAGKELEFRVIHSFMKKEDPDDNSWGC